LKPIFTVFHKPRTPAPRPAKPVTGLGDAIATVATPIARALGAGCVDPATGELKEKSPCAKRKEALNKILPFK